MTTSAPTSLLSASTQRRGTTESLSDMAYRRIKEKIVALELPPASLIEEAGLANELDVGLTPIRQALRRLAMENLVVIWPRRGTLVADLNSSDLHKLFEMRIELETLSTQLAAQRATPEQVAAMEALLAEAASLLEQDDNRALMEADHQMHVLIAQAAHNEFLAETLDWLYSHVRRLWNLSIDSVSGLTDALREHGEIVAAIQAGDAQRAGTLMRAHVQRFQQEIVDTL